MKKLFLSLFFASFLFTSSFAQEALIGEIKMFAGNFAPRGWAFCNGQLLPISQNSALFSILGTTYGGDGRTTFALPDLRGRVPIGPGNGPGLSTYIPGQKGGQENVTLLQQNMPLGMGQSAQVYSGREQSPINGVTTGSSQPIENRQPYVAIHYIICLQGIYPSRN
jgi:microcystin-dependent protein